LIAVLFVFHVNYVRFHLLSEEHLDDFHDNVADSASHDGGDDHDGAHHKPHAALDHLVQMFAKHQDLLLAIEFPPSLSSLCLTPPAARAALILNDRWVLPGESPPDPLQPRGPPFS
jgi:hypothetical protein